MIFHGQQQMIDYDFRKIKRKKTVKKEDKESIELSVNSI